MIERKTEMKVIIEHTFETKDKVWLSEEERKEFIAKAVSSAIATIIVYKALFGDE